MEEYNFIRPFSILKATKNDQWVAYIVNNGRVLVPRLYTVTFAFCNLPSEGFHIQWEKGRVIFILTIGVIALMHSLWIVITSK